MLYDISPALTEQLAPWPGDRAFEAIGGELGVPGAFRISAHAGSHADAPRHIVGGVTMECCDLERFVGPCQVLHARVGRGEVVSAASLTEVVRAERVLFRTDTYPDATSFHEDFAGLSAELADELAERGVRLVGIDTPSVDAFAAEDLPVHRRLLGREVAILEGLRLGDVPAGMYELIALPLKLVGFDGSPVRAVLRGVTR